MSDYYDRPLHVCRFCGEHSHYDWMVKYGTRHYAHFECFPIDRVRNLPPYQHARFQEWLKEDNSL